MMKHKRAILFRDPELRKTISVYPDASGNTYKVLRGMNVKDQIVNTELKKTIDEIKQLWIDSVINGFVVEENTLFPNGIMDCLLPETIKILEEKIEEQEKAKNIVYDI